jgi:two-component system cell cycle sensor histidine kinase/response regulator CckA
MPERRCRAVTATGGHPTSKGAAGARFRQMLEDLLVVVFEADAELRVRYVSGRAAMAFGYEVGEWVGSSEIWTRLVHEEDRPVFEAAAREALSSGSETEIEFRVRTAHGVTLWVRTLLGAVPVSRRRVHLRGVMLDVTDRRYAEGSARQYAERMRRLLDHSADPLLVHDARGRIVEGNRAASDALGYTRRELLEMSVRDVELGHEEARARESWLALGPGRRQVEEVRCLRRDGTVLPAESHRNLFEWEGQALFVVLYRDITERRHLEAQLRQSQKLEEVGRLTGGLAHDFHNMLTAIKGHAELLLSGTGVDPHRSDLEQIAHAADRATVLTRKLLAFSRRGAVTAETVDVNALVEETTRLLGPLIGETIDLRTELGARGVVRGDRSQFEQVLVNLVVNARDAMPEGGVLTVTTTNVEVSLERPFRHEFVLPGRYVKIRVADTGHGMDEATRLRVFDPFFTTKEPGKGSGLGLSTVYGIVKESGGFIIVESEPGRGARFLVLLPESQAEVLSPVVPVAEAQVSAPADACTVLVVEDEPAVRSLIRRIMERDGHTVLEAVDGERALEISRGCGTGIDVLVTDVMMPGMGGPALARILAAERPDLRVILTSGYGDDIVTAPRGVRPAYFLEKPFSPDQLSRAVRDVLSGPPPDLVQDAPES